MVRLAVILAAGLGERLGAEIPKPLVEVGGRSLLARMLSACAAVGVVESVIVTGHRAETLRCFAERWRSAPRLRLVHNPDHARAGNARSLAVAMRSFAAETFVKLDGDLLLDESVLASLARDGPSALGFDRRGVLDGEAMKVRLKNRKVVTIGKDVGDADGESIGIERIHALDHPALLSALGRVKGYYEAAYQHMIDDGWALRTEEVGGRWMEIDTPRDLALAQRRWS